MFNSNNFKEINYLNFDTDFSIDLGDKIKIILGPNGTGKTSIYRNIKNRFPNYSFIDYSEVEQSVISKKNEIIIGASIVLLDNKNEEKENLINSIDVKGNLKKFNITNKKSAELISKNLELLRKEPEKAIENFSAENLECIFSMNNDNRIFFDENARKIIELEKITTEIKDIKDNFKKHFLEEINNYLDNTEKVCPVCGKENDEPIKVVIERKLFEIKDIEEEIVKNYQSSHSQLKPEEILENVKGVKSIISENNFTIKNLENYLICEGNKEKTEIILSAKTKLKELNKDIEELKNQKEKFYENLKKHSESLISTFQLQFSVKSTDIIFDETNKMIQIRLPRKVEEYSTGEINLMTFTVCILEFVSSDKEKLIIDDPLSSYDIPNQYKIMYEITSAKDDTKQILIFTHNVDTINIANTQYNALFEYSVLEKRKNILYLNKINFSTTNNILSIYELLKNINPTYTHYNYLKLLTKKETWDDNNLDEYENHLIFHYDEPFSKDIDGINYKNDYLVDLIDKFDDDTFKNISYLENTANKIIYTAALRIWIEKQFYDVSHNDAQLHEKQFGPKIKYIFSGNRWKGSTKVTREYLMSKKVMLNQHIHQSSQIMPFYFTLNLTYDDISKEILDIKEHFKIS